MSPWFGGRYAGDTHMHVCTRTHPRRLWMDCAARGWVCRKCALSSHSTGGVQWFFAARHVDSSGEGGCHCFRRYYVFWKMLPRAFSKTRFSRPALSPLSTCFFRAVKTILLRPLYELTPTSILSATPPPPPNRVTSAMSLEFIFTSFRGTFAFAAPDNLARSVRKCVYIHR